jgi:ATP adenylyltransferase
VSVKGQSLERLWSPWRIEYILGEKTEGCVFCKAFAADESQDKAYLILHRGVHNAVIMNLYPYNNGHLMIIPYEHRETFEGLPVEALTEAMVLMNKCVAVLRLAMDAQGFNVGVNMGKVAGAGIDEHVHMHVLPRWSGDTNFITTLGRTRCIPQSLHEAYQELKVAWEALKT